MDTLLPSLENYMISLAHFDVVTGVDLLPEN